LIGKLRSRIPEIVLRTTAIVGFPGESEEQFAELLEFVREQRFERLGAFTYSQEEGTPAAEFDGQVDEDVKVARLDMIMLVQSEISEEINQSKVGETFSVLVEGYDTIVKQYYGRTYADSVEIDGKIFFTAAKRLQDGEFVKVKITDYMEYDLFGEAAE